jgi:hypothetical protein
MIYDYFNVDEFEADKLVIEGENQDYSWDLGGEMKIKVGILRGKGASHGGKLEIKTIDKTVSNRKNINR